MFLDFFNCKLSMSSCGRFEICVIFRFVLSLCTFVAWKSFSRAISAGTLYAGRICFGVFVQGHLFWVVTSWFAPSVKVSNVFY